MIFLTQKIKVQSEVDKVKEERFKGNTSELAKEDEPEILQVNDYDNQPATPDVQASSILGKKARELQTDSLLQKTSKDNEDQDSAENLQQSVPSNIFRSDNRTQKEVSIET